MGKKEAAAEIHLDKFSGEESGQDYYSFKSTFEKKYKDVRKTNVIDILKSYLKKEALESVKELTETEEIWKRLKCNFGDPNVMLRRKMTRIYELANIGTRKSASEVKDSLVSLTNSLTDVIKLVADHKIQVKLYSKHEVDDVVARLPAWCSNAWDIESLKLDSDLTDEERWKRFVEFLERQTKLQKLKVERETSTKIKQVKVEEKKPALSESPGKGKSSKYHSTHHVNSNDGTCLLSCGRSHGNSLFECQRFLRVKKPSERFDLVKKYKGCFQCLGEYSGKDHKNNCNNTYSCPHADHQRYDIRNHVAICQRHCDERENKDLFERFKKEVMKTATWANDVKLSFFSSTAALSYQTRSESVNGDHENHPDVDKEITDEAMFLLQVVEIDGEHYNVFFDDGCGGSIVSKRARDKLGERAEQLSSRIIEIGGVGECTTQASHGLYKYTLPLASGRQGVLVGPCMDSITHEFPTFPLDKIMSEVKEEAEKIGKKTNKWPVVHPTCGGHTDIMIGIRYRRYYPVEICRLPSGLSIHEFLLRARWVSWCSWGS